MWLSRGTNTTAEERFANLKISVRCGLKSHVDELITLTPAGVL